MLGTIDHTAVYDIIDALALAQGPQLLAAVKRLSEHAPDISTFAAACIFTFGFLMIWVNYDSDNQRYVFLLFSPGECFWSECDCRLLVFGLSRVLSCGGDVEFVAH